ncbi:hypothetical protein BMT54_08335 [Pasteurellaceae bacterium 15-036681]|nr:hypothetical protein BMT54_08335 [Pasteurellaceae bacterium 15-036681]
MTQANERFLRLEDVIAKTGLKRSTIYSKIKSGEFPKSIAISANSVAWLESEINHWIQIKVKQREYKEQK